MTGLFLRYVNGGLAVGAVVLLLWLCSALLDRLCAAKWKRLVWLVLTLWLLFPIELRLFRPRVVVPVALPEITGEGIALVLGQGAETVSRRLSGLDILALAWLAGTALSAGIYIMSYILFRRRLRREAKSLTDEAVLAVLKAEGEVMGLRRLPRVCRWDKGGSPMAAGVMRPILVLPEETYSLEELSFIFRHELSHIKRGDLLIKALMAAAAALHWYNPAVRLIPRLADVDMELSCDDEATKAYPYAVRKAYAELLFSFVRRQYKKSAGKPARAYTTQFYGGKTIMKKRLGNILSGGKRRGAVLILIAAALVLVLGSIAACGEIPAAIGMSGGSSTPVATAAPEVDPSKITERERLLDTMHGFASAYVGGDEETLRSYLTETFDGSTEIYPVGRPRIVSAKGADSLENVFRVEEGVVYPVRIEFMDDMNVPGKNEDVYAFLGMEAVKTSDDWRIQAFRLGTPDMPGEVVAVAAKEVSPPTERDRLSDMLREFVRAYVDGDETALRSYLIDGYNGPAALDYDDEPPYKITLRGPEALDGVASVADGEIYPVKAELMIVCGDSEADVRFSHLDMEAVKTSNGWRVRFYGLEK